MAILVNMGNRGFILKEGFLAPGKELVVDNETAHKLSSIYKGELKVIYAEGPAKAKEEKIEEPAKELVAEEPVAEAPKAKRKYTRKAKTAKAE